MRNCFSIVAIFTTTITLLVGLPLSCALSSEQPEQPGEPYVTQESEKPAAPKQEGKKKDTEPEANAKPAASPTKESTAPVKAVAAPTSKKRDEPAKDPDEVSAITFDDLKFDIEPDGDFSRDMLTEKINKLNGTRIRVSGYIRPSFSQSGLTKFIFVRDNKECCFGPGAALYDCIMVKLAKGKKTDYTVRPVAIEGKFTLKEFTVGGRTWAIYRMTDTEVK